MSGAEAVRTEAPTPAPRPSAGWLPLVLAVVVPLAILGGVLAAFGAPPPALEKTADATRLEAVLDKRGADVVVLGNSKTTMDIDPDALSAGLPDAPKVAPLGVDGTRSATWFAVLENRVFGTGRTPRVVIVYAPMTWAFELSTGGQLDRKQLAAQVAAEEPVLDTKLYGRAGGGGVSARVRAQLGELREAGMDTLRDASVGLVLGEGEGGLVERGHAVAEPALKSLFGAATGGAMVERQQAIPIAEREDDAAAKGPVDLDATLFPDFLALAEAHGARLVYVRAPLSTTFTPPDVVPAETERALVDLLNAHGAGYLDLRGVVGDDGYSDGIHLNPFGRSKLTEALAKGLSGIGALGDGPIVATRVHTRPTVTRTGTPPALPEVKPTRGPAACGWQTPTHELDVVSDHALQRDRLGTVSPLLLTEDGVALKPHAPREEFDEACKGAFMHQIGVVKFSPTGADPAVVPTRRYAFALSDQVPVPGFKQERGWWVYPGTALEFAFPEGWDTKGDFRVAVAGRARGGTGAGTVQVGDGAPVPLTGEGEVVSTSRSGEAPKGAWTLRVASPPGGPWLLLRRVVVGEPADALYVVGEADAGRKVLALRSPATYAAPPAPLAPLPTPKAFDAHVATVDAKALGVPSDDEVGRTAGIYARCSPLRIAEDGVPLAMPNQAPTEVAKGGGRYGSVGGVVTLTGNDGTAPGANGHAYTALLDATRKCEWHRWLYPGDDVRFAVDPGLLPTFERGATALELGGASMAAAPGVALRVQVRVDGETVLDATTPADTLKASPPTLPLARPVGVGAKAVEVEISAPPGAPYVLLTTVSLVEPPAPAFP